MTRLEGRMARVGFTGWCSGDDRPIEQWARPGAVCNFSHMTVDSFCQVKQVQEPLTAHDGWVS